MIRTYQPSDKEALLQLIRLNTPDYFSPEEEKEFSEYLDSGIEDYFVILRNDSLMGCGGINYEKEGTEGILSWDMIHPDFHGQGLGTKLVEHRLTFLRQNPLVKTTRVRTAQFTHLFYGKFGFETVRMEKDYWAKGYDLYEMVLTFE